MPSFLILNNNPCLHILTKAFFKVKEYVVDPLLLLDLLKDVVFTWSSISKSRLKFIKPTVYFYDSLLFIRLFKIRLMANSPDYYIR